MSAGDTRREIIQLNIETLWSGGPFADPVIRSLSSRGPILLTHKPMQNYNGGNKQSFERDAMAKAMKNIRQTIFESPIGEIDSP